MEIGEIKWELNKPVGRDTLHTVKVQFSFRQTDVAAGDSRGKWHWDTAIYPWDASLRGSEIEKAILNTCRLKIGLLAIS